MVISVSGMGIWWDSVGKEGKGWPCSDGSLVSSSDLVHSGPSLVQSSMFRPGDVRFGLPWLPATSGTCLMVGSGCDMLCFRPFQQLEIINQSLWVAWWVSCRGFQMFWEPLSCCSYCCMGARALTCCFMIFFLYSLFLSWYIWDFVFLNSFIWRRFLWI